MIYEGAFGLRVFSERPEENPIVNVGTLPRYALKPHPSHNTVDSFQFSPNITSSIPSEDILIDIPRPIDLSP